MSCHQLITQGSYKTKAKKQAKVFPQLRLTYRASITSPSSSSSSFKRKKSSNGCWTDESEEGSMVKRVKNKDLHNWVGIRLVYKGFEYLFGESFNSIASDWLRG